MPFLGWMLDVAREQSPSEEGLRTICARSRAAGYDAVGLYLEHRYAYPSAPFAAGPGCLTPDVVRRLAAESRSRGLRLIPFLNTLGHMEGFIRSEGGQWLAEGPARFGSTQICATRPECFEFARGLVADVLAAFDDEWIHLGGDAARVAQVGTAGLYADYMGRLCRYVLEQGRRPALWGDMLLAHPAALDALPAQTLIFDWQYDRSPRESAAFFRGRGFEVVCCPAVRSYDAGWCHLGQTQQWVDEHAAVAGAGGALGVLLTAWEFSFFSQLSGVLPLIYAAGRRLRSGTPWAEAVAAEGGRAYARAAEILGNRVPAAAEFLAPGKWRQLRDSLVIRQNPFLLWASWRDEACGPAGDEVLRLCDDAASGLPAEDPLQAAIELHRVAVAWVRLVEKAYQRYAAGDVGGCRCLLADGPGVLERLRPGLEQAVQCGGSQADLARLDRLAECVGQVCRRLDSLSGSWRPAFQTLVDDHYVCGDQAAWATAGLL